MSDKEIEFLGIFQKLSLGEQNECIASLRALLDSKERRPQQ